MGLPAGRSVKETVEVVQGHDDCEDEVLVVLYEVVDKVLIAAWLVVVTIGP